ncbi:MAG: bifunctional (p)ppGpp synthetase/guanosine-3',5'-bis(diphosphate) 3'-pyrophosphohydrolase [Firmicutes bacterium]|jgi:GTP pyrophosphokinase|nr:bifunctional (p)ppGpp synthetase/guanosine-3',5'-bis(diphosphate) 3'-pyrophosphohydrolase [Bacillota bacterium]
MTGEDLIATVRSYSRDGSCGLVEKAYRFSADAHRGMKRQSGEDFIQHPLAVASILAELQMDQVTIAAALLHDVVEDTGVQVAAIQEEFGGEIAHLVDGVTKLGRIEFKSPVERKVENLRKMFLAMADDLRVIIIKLADRLHNMRTLTALPPEKRRRVADETLEIYAPLAHRLGIWRFKWELEDLAFRYCEPGEYHDLADRIAKQRSEREAYTNRVIAELRSRLSEASIQADVQGRAKHLYSIWRKMSEESRDLSEIYDLIAVRVVVDSVRECYDVLGIVHTMWKPIPGRFKDYIAMPKANMYQSLHTTVMGPEGEPFEIQIRTWEMHRTAEYGVAAHWMYKEGVSKVDKDYQEKLAWLRQILEWQRELGDASEFMESLKIDLFDDEVFVFTPKGDVIDLPAGSTPLDFAYQIHTDVGHRCTGAKVNSRIVPLDYKLKNGDIVEILTSKHSAGPSRDWMNIVKTSSARNKIRAWFKKERHEENVARGRELLEREVERQGLDRQNLLTAELLKSLAARMNFQGQDDLLAAIGYGGFTPQYIVSRLRDEYKKALKPVSLPEQAFQIETRPPAKRKTGDGVIVRGLENLLVRFSRCCNPVPGDAIIGFITRGRGVSIHRVDCPNIVHYSDDAERLIEVAWAEHEAAYPVEISVTAMDRPGLLSDIASVVADTRTNILSARALTSKHTRAVLDLVLEIRDLEHLQHIKNRITRVKDVLKVERVVRDHGKVSSRAGEIG